MKHDMRHIRRYNESATVLKGMQYDKLRWGGDVVRFTPAELNKLRVQMKSYDEDYTDEDFEQTITFGSKDGRLRFTVTKTGSGFLLAVVRHGGFSSEYHLFPDLRRAMIKIDREKKAR